MTSDARIGGILLMAGRSSRMGEPKALLTIEGKTFARIIFDKMMGAGLDDMVGVVSPELYAQRANLQADGLALAVNDRQELEMAESIKAGWGALARPFEAVLIALCDHPFVKDETFGALVRKARSNPGRILIPSYRGKGGHPVVTPADLEAEIMALPKNRGLNAVFEANADRIEQIEVDDPGIRLDIDSPEDFKNARRLSGGFDPDAP